MLTDSDINNLGAGKWPNSKSPGSRQTGLTRRTPQKLFIVSSPFLLVTNDAPELNAEMSSALLLSVNMTSFRTVCNRAGGPI